MGEHNEYTIDVEYLGEERFYKTYSRIGTRIVGVFFYIMMIIYIISFFIKDNRASSDNIWGLILGILLGGGLGSLAFFAQLRNELHLVGGSAQVMFLLNKPSKEEMENFINEIINRSCKILIDKYSKVDPDLPEDIQIRNLYWLKEKGLISEEKYEELKQEYRNLKLMQ